VIDIWLIKERLDVAQLGGTRSFDDWIKPPIAGRRNRRCNNKTPNQH
jgi:hypothetical protein